jgi:tRNA A-37 threonylcarbamoyl transferase component Bud32
MTNAERVNRPGALSRLQELRERDRTKALFGDSPPPQRHPAPYPEGEIIYHCQNRYVVRHGDTVTKYTTYPHGFGANDQPNEALALRFIKEHTTIPVPEVISSDWDRITMEYVEGQTLHQAWPVLTLDQRSGILAQLSDYIAQMRALGGIYLGRLDGQGVMLPSIFPRSGGPFGTLTEFHDWLVQPPLRLEAESMYWHQITTQLGAEYSIVFTHGDISSRNIIISEGRIVALLDWEFAGWYPEYWEYVFALRGLDNIDWETLGRQLPCLFTKRYDVEYILVMFILKIS